MYLYLYSDSINRERTMAGEVLIVFLTFHDSCLFWNTTLVEKQMYTRCLGGCFIWHHPSRANVDVFPVWFCWDWETLFDKLVEWPQKVKSCYRNASKHGSQYPSIPRKKKKIRGDRPNAGCFQGPHVIIFGGWAWSSVDAEFTYGERVVF